MVQSSSASGTAMVLGKDTDVRGSLRYCHCWRGAAGCVVASYLAEHTDASIAPIEAGDTDRDPFIHIPAGFAKMLAHDWHVWKYETHPQHGTRRAYRSGKVPGGGSSINAMCYVRGQVRDYAAWQDAVGDTGKWSYEDLLPVFMAQEHNDTFHDEYHVIGGGLAVQLPKGINELNQYCLKAFQEYGFPIIPTITARADRRFTGAVNGRKSAAAQRG
jgi:choline dehydrogenase-like flavoprotein